MKPFISLTFDHPVSSSEWVDVHLNGEPHRVGWGAVATALAWLGDGMRDFENEEAPLTFPLAGVPVPLVGWQTMRSAMSGALLIQTDTVLSVQRRHFVGEDWYRAAWRVLTVNDGSPIVSYDTSDNPAVGQALAAQAFATLALVDTVRELVQLKEATA